jgi:hypothetical protein
MVEKRGGCRKKQRFDVMVEEIVSDKKNVQLTKSDP